jgi:arylsulfatase A-like enzyme/cytochrome c-type biogenesis protein CcmH/NrfG
MPATVTRIAAALLGLALVAPWVGCGSADEPEAAAPAAGAAPGPARRVVLVSIDTLRADWLGAYDPERPYSPNLDAFAEAGVRFEVAIAPVPITLPSHATMHTGLQPPHHGVRTNSIFRLEEDVPTLAESLRAQGFATGAFVGAVVLASRFGLARGFDVYDDQMGGRQSGLKGAGFPERTAGEVVEAALAWAQDAPDAFFLWVHVYDPHMDHQAPQKWLDRFPDEPYGAEIAYTDAQIGRLVAGIEALHPDDRTLFVITSDHGDAFWEHGDPTHSYTLYDATQRVPLLMRGPGLPEGAVVGGVAQLADIAPTVLSAVGAPPLPRSDGVALQAAISGAAEPPSAAYVETIATRLEFGWSPVYGLRTPEFKYLRAPRPELYALAQDPQELNDLAATLPAVVDELDARLEEILVDARPLAMQDEIPEEERAMLESLGYVVTSGAGIGDDATRVGGIDPKDGVALFALLGEAKEAALRGDHAAAWEKAQQMIGEGPHLDHYKAGFALRAGRMAEAEALARGGVEKAPGWFATHLQLADVLRAQGRREEARTGYREAARINPDTSAPWLALARMDMEDGNLEAATRSLDQAIASNNRTPEALWRRAALHFAAGEGEAGRELIGELPPKLLSQPGVVRNLAAGEFQGGDPAAARERVSAALKLHPKDEMLLQMKAELDAVQTRSGS